MIYQIIIDRPVVILSRVPARAFALVNIIWGRKVRPDFNIDRIDRGLLAALGVRLELRHGLIGRACKIQILMFDRHVWRLVLTAV